MAYGLNKPGLIENVRRKMTNGLPSELKESEEFFIASVEDQKPFLPIWYRNIAYYMGLQWMDWNQQNQFLSHPNMPSWKVRMVINLIMPTIRTEAAKILKTNPSIAVMPGQDSEESRQASRMGTRIMDAKYREDDYQRRLYNLTIWMLVCGSSYLWTLWDKTAGRAWSDDVKNPETGLFERKQFFAGDVMDQVSGPFETLLEPMPPEDFNDHRRIQRVRLMDVNFIKDKWGVTVKPEGVDPQTNFQFRISSMSHLNQFGVGAPRNQFANRKMVLVKEEFQLPSSKWKEGLYVMWANGQVIEEPQELGYWLRGRRALPVSKFDHITVPGRSQGMSVIEQIGPLNVLLNKLTSQAVENANMISRPKYKVPQGSIDDDSITDQPGEVLEYRPIGGLGPEPLTPPSMPQYFFQLKDSIPGSIADVSGIFDVSKGKLPRRATSGKAIDLLQDADDTRMGLTIKNFGSSLERAMGLKLALMKDRYKEERLVKKVGGSHGLEILRFKTADMKDWDTVYVTMTPALSRGAKIQIGLKLGEAGIIPPDMVLKMIEIGDLNMVFDKDSDQMNFAKMENFMMARGDILEPQDFEPHGLHLEEHINFMRKWEGKISPDAMNNIRQHSQIHKEMLAVLSPAGGPPSGGGVSATPPQEGTPLNEAGQAAL